MKNLVFPKLPDAGGGGVGDRDFWLSGVWDLRGCVPEPATAAGGSGGWSPGPEKLVQEAESFFCGCLLNQEEEESRKRRISCFSCAASVFVRALVSVCACVFVNVRPLPLKRSPREDGSRQSKKEKKFLNLIKGSEDCAVVVSAPP